MRFIAGAMLLALVATTGPAQADSVAYGAVVDLQAQGSDFKVVHHHDWSRATQAKRNSMMGTHQDPFRAGNDYGHVAWYASDGRLVRRLPSPALTWLGVSPDSRYVIGLSNVMLDNPYQLVVWSRGGELLLKRRIAPRVACLPPAEYRELLGAYPKQFDALRARVWSGDGVVYVDFLSKGMPDRLGKLWGVFLSKTCASPWSPNFSESVTNWVFWYDEADPRPEVVETQGKPTALRFQDPQGRVATIPFQLEAPGR